MKKIFNTGKEIPIILFENFLFDFQLVINSIDKDMYKKAHPR